MGENLHRVLAPEAYHSEIFEGFGRFRETGEGAAMRAHGELFKPFNTSKSSGTGLGLSFCKIAVGAHGGRIEEESKVGVRTTFTMTLPVKH